MEPPAAVTEPARRGLLALPAGIWPLALTYLAIAMNMTVATIALPTISIELDATASELTWIVNATPMMAGALVLFMGALSDRVGSRRILLVGVTVFLIAAVLSGFATEPEHLIVLRGLSGVGSALAMPSALALTFTVAAGDSQRTAVGIMGATQAIGAMFGPLVGGAALVAFGWGAAFWSVAPMLVLAFIGIVTLLPADASTSGGTTGSGAPQRPSTPLDAWGAGLTALVAVCFLFAAVALASATTTDDAEAAVAAVLGVIALTGLIWWERRCPAPLFVGSIVRRRTFAVPTVTVFTVQFTLGGLLILNTMYLQLVLGFSALAAGAMLLPALVMWTAASATAGVSANRLGVRRVVVVALLLAAVGLALLPLGGREPNFGWYVVGLLLLGTMGVAPALMTHTAVSTYPPERRSVGSAINSMAIRFGLAFGVAVYSTLLALTYRRDLAAALAPLPADDAATAQESVGGALRIADQAAGPGGEALAEAARDAFAHGFQTTLLLAAAVLVVLAAVVWRWLPATLPTRAPTAGQPTPGQPSNGHPTRENPTTERDDPS